MHIIGVAAIFLFREIMKYIIRKKGRLAVSTGNNKMFVITDKKNLDETLTRIEKYNYRMYQISGVCVLDADMKGKTYKDFDIIVNKDEVLSYLCHNWVDEVFVDMNMQDVPQEIIDGLAVAGITADFRISNIEEFEGREQRVQKIFNTNVLNTTIRARTATEVFLKRLMDILGGIVGSIITIILTIFIGPAIFIKSPGPIFYKQERIGQNGRHFYIYKFRSMVTNADELKKDLMAQNRIKDGMMFKVKDDPRIIPGIGEFIRKTSLDEFPQFFNVVIGNMSLVGTRPPTVDEWEKYRLEHRIRMAIKPGITGLWQISGRSKITDFDKVIEYDTKYINNWSLGLDIEILFKTIVVLFSKREDEAM